MQYNGLSYWNAVRQSFVDAWARILTDEYSNHEDPFITGFLNNYFLRPTCYECPVRKQKSNADITIEDYGGYDGNLAIDDDD